MPKMSTNVRFISGDDIRRILSYPELIQEMEKTFALFSKRTPESVVQPVRTVMQIKDTRGVFAMMPAYIRDEKALAIKLGTVFPENKDVPTHNLMIVVYDTSNGVPHTIMDGDVITEMRTACASAVATKYLAPPNSRILAIIGSGVQAKSHLLAMKELFPLREIRVWSRTHANAVKFAEKFGAKACETVKEAVRDADIIVTVTFSHTPILKSDWVKDGAHINCVGATQPHQQELESDLTRRAVVYVDTYEGARKESGDIVLSKAKIYGEIGEVLNGQKTAWRKETTIFKSLGMAVEDVMSANLVCRKLSANL